jgi:ABC-type long-subunit fatty acid transport system fused permease/ATPase subunit
MCVIRGALIWLAVLMTIAGGLMLLGLTGPSSPRIEFPSQRAEKCVRPQSWNCMRDHTGWV